MRRPLTVSRRGPGLLGTMARTAVVAGTASAVAGGVSDARRQRADQQAALTDITVQQQQLQAQQEALAQQQQSLAMQQQQAAPAPVATAPAAASSGGLSQEAIARLQQLAELQKQGILSPDEFAQQKARILES